jgi:hypothetical protein
MVGLEKMKAKAGEVSSSAWALFLDQLYNHCTNQSLSVAAMRWGIVRYASPPLLLS